MPIAVDNLAAILAAPAAPADGAALPAVATPQAVATRPVDAPDRRDPWQAAAAANRQQATERRNAVALWWQLRTTGGLTREQAADQVARHHRDFPVLAVAGHGGASALTLRNLTHWAELLGRRADARPDLENVVALLDKYGQRGGRQCYALQCPEFLREFARLYESGNQMRFDTAHRYAKTLCLDRGMHPEQVPSLASLQTYYERYRPAAAVRLARARDTDERRALSAHITRDYSDVWPGRCLVADHRQLDIPIRVALPNTDGWEARRPWVTVFMDLRSRYVVSFAVSEIAPSRLTVLQCLFQAVRTMGDCPPAELYIDNGKDFLALGVAKEVDWAGHAQSVCRDLGIKVRKAIPHNPEAKTVENFYGIMAREFDKLHPSYRGGSPEARPDAAQIAWARPETLPNLDQATVLMAAWLDKFYHPKPQESAATGGRSPDTVWGEYRPARVPLTEDQLQLAFTIPLRSARKVYPGGIVKLGGVKYRSERLYDLVDREVWLRAVTASDDLVLACRADGAVICQATRCGTVPALCEDDDYELLAAAMRQKAHWLAHVRAASRVASGATKAVPLVDPWRILAPKMDPAQLAAAVEQVSSLTPAAPCANAHPAAGLPADSAIPQPRHTPAESAPPARRTSAEDARLLERILGGHETADPDAGAPRAAAGARADSALLLDLLTGGNP